MADSKTQLEALKAAASDYQSQLQYAPTKDEALTLAIHAAESLMKAMKLTSDSQEKKQIKSQCSSIMDVAGRIKSSDQWVPLLATTAPVPAPKSPKDIEINRWASDVAQSVTASTSQAHSTPNILAGMSSDSRTHIGEVSDQTLSSARATTIASPHTDTLPTPISSPAVAIQDEIASSNPSQKNSAHSLLIDLSQSTLSRPTATDSEATDRSQIVNSRLDNKGTPQIQKNAPVAGTDQTNDTRTSVSDNTAASNPHTHVRRLVEPISTRKRAKKEDIILLRASVMNGFKFPPWEKAPPSSEFVLDKEAQPFKDKYDLTLSTYQLQFFLDWIRPQEALPPPSMFPDNRSGLGPLMRASQSIDLVQDAATDCSVVASLCAAIARAERGHDQILSKMISPYDKNLGRPVMSPNGKYVVRLNFNGCWRRVEIDDRLPVSKTHRLLHVIDRKNPALLWPALLEKAYLKVRGGYDFPGSNSCSDLWTLTGWVPEQIYLQETDLVPSQLWKRVYNGFLYGDVLVTVGTGKMSTKQERELGLEGQHSYVVLDMKETDHDRLLLVKNPWVEGRGWRGLRPQAAPLVETSSSSESTNRGGEIHNRDSIASRDRPHPTTFWIALEHVVQHFESLYLNWNPGLFKRRQDIHFDWRIENQQGTGRCLVDFPQFSFTTKEGGAVWLLLSRHFRDSPAEAREEADAFQDGTMRPGSQVDSSGESQKGYMSINVSNGHGERLYIKETCLECGPYVNTTQSLLRWESEANSTYTIVIDQDELPPSTYTFSLSAFSNTNMLLEPAVQKHSFQKILQAEWSKQSAGGNTSSPRYFENPQFSLEVKRNCDVAILLVAQDHSHHMHAKLALGYGKRIYKLQSRDVLADSGDHRDECVLVQTKDLQPGLYTIICSLFEPNQTGNFTLRVDSTSEVLVKQIARDGAGLLSKKVAPACFGPNMHKVAAPIVPHRLATYTIVARFLKAASPRSHDLGMLARSPLRLSVELGRGPDRKFLIASEQGQYSDSAIVRSESLNIDPVLAQQNDLWLVLDRLHGPGGPVEEWYEVEIFHDVPQAFSIGVWREWDS